MIMNPNTKLCSFNKWSNWLAISPFYDS